MTCGGFIFIYIQKRIYYPLPHDIICCPLKCFMGVRMVFVKCKSGKSTEKIKEYFGMKYLFLTFVHKINLRYEKEKHIIIGFLMCRNDHSGTEGA